MIHVLHFGFPMCGFSHEEPRSWPEGHQWVRLDDYGLSDCDACKTAARDLLNKKAEQEADRGMGKNGSQREQA